jgi:hypothetical protein
MEKQVKETLIELSSAQAMCSNVRMCRLQKKIIRIPMVARTRDSCKELFKSLKILPLTSHYIVSLARL